ncbi:MAG: hypothetical protein AAF717_11830 [Bacteroidota bacterium]
MKILLKPFSLFFSVITLLVSCSDDDDAQPAGLELAGTWVLTQITVSAPIDGDLNGTSSSNLLDEADCLEDTILLNTNFEWSSTTVTPNITSITGDLFSVSCSTVENLNGDWGLSEGNLLLVGSVSRTFMINGDQLIENIEEDLPGIRTFVYQRQQ